MKTNWSARSRKRRRSRSMSSGVKAIQSTTTSNRWPASARSAAAASRRSATSDVAPRARSGSLPRFRRNSSTPRSTARRVQALLIRPVPPTNRTFMHGLLYERKRMSSIAAQEPQAAAARSALLHGHVELEEGGLLPDQPDLGQGAVPDGGIQPPVIAERRPKEPAQRQPDHAVVRHDEDPAFRVRVGDVVQAGHEAAGGRHGILSSRQVIGDRVDAEGSELGRKPLTPFLRRPPLPIAEVQLPEPGIDLQSQTRQIGARGRGAERPTQRGGPDRATTGLRSPRRQLRRLLEPARG